MKCNLETIRSKEVIDIKTGERLGFIDDAEFDLSQSAVKSFIIYGRERFFGLFGREEDIVIPCCEIEVIGQDVMLVNRKEEARRVRTTKYRRFQPESLFK